MFLYDGPFHTVMDMGETLTFLLGNVRTSPLPWSVLKVNKGF